MVMDVNMFIMIVLMIFTALEITYAAICGYKRANAKAEKDEAAAAWYGTQERIWTIVSWFSFLELLAVAQNDLLTNSFIEITTALEALKNG